MKIMSRSRVVTMAMPRSELSRAGMPPERTSCVLCVVFMAVSSIVVHRKIARIHHDRHRFDLVRPPIKAVAENVGGGEVWSGPPDECDLNRADQRVVMGLGRTSADVGRGVVVIRRLVVGRASGDAI